MNFTKVVIKDWHGIFGEFDIVNLLKREIGLFSCTFRNSNGEIEKTVVDEQSLYQG